MAKHPSGANDEELIRSGSEILNVLAKNPSLLSNMVSLLLDHERLQSTHDHHRSVFNEFLGGNTEKEGELHASRGALKTEIRLFHGCAMLVGCKDPSIPQTLGLVQQQPPVTKRTTVHLHEVPNPRAVYEKKKMVLRADGVKGAKSFEVWCCEGDPMTESNWRYLTGSVRVNRIELTGLGLTPGKLYFFRIRAISSHGIGPWSNFVSLIAI